MSAVALNTDDFYTDLPVGEILRRARMQKGLSVTEAATYLFIREQHLESLERSDFDALPGRVYVIGFVRTYAEFLGLDGARVIHLLKRQSQGLGTPQSLNAHLLPSDSRLPSVPIIAVAFAALLLVMIIWISYQGARIGDVDHIIDVPHKTDDMAVLEKMAAEPAPVSVNVPSVKPTVLPAPKVVAAPVRIEIVADSWIELRNPEGRVVEARVFRAGEGFNIADPIDEFGRAHTITMGNAAGVKILVDGAAVPPLGGENKVRRNVSLKPETLRALVPR